MKKKIEALLNELTKKHPTDNRNYIQRFQSNFIWIDDPAGKELLKIISNTTRYSIFNERLQYLALKGYLVTFAKLTDWLINRTRQVGAARAIDDLDHYVSSKEVSVDFVELILGVHLSPTPFEYKGYTFKNGVKITSLNDLRNQQLASDLTGELIIHQLPYPRIFTVLICSCDQPVEHEKTDTSEARMNIIHSTLEKLENARLCLSLVRDVKYGTHCLAYSCIAPDNLPFINPVAGWALFTAKTPALQTVIKPTELQQADQLTEKFTKLNESFRTKLKIPLYKLSDFGTHDKLVDRAIDLRVCLEAIFLGGGVKDQLRYTLSLRAARFLGSTIEERKKILKVIKGAYDVSSTAVHNGKFSKKDKLDYLEEAAKLAQQALIKLIKEGEPNWEEIELQ